MCVPNSNQINQDSIVLGYQIIHIKKIAVNHLLTLRSRAPTALRLFPINNWTSSTKFFFRPFTVHMIFDHALTRMYYMHISSLGILTNRFSPKLLTITYDGWQGERRSGCPTSPTCSCLIATLGGSRMCPIATSSQPAKCYNINYRIRVPIIFNLLCKLDADDHLNCSHVREHGI